MKTCLIGGAGFIGTALSDLLILKGREVAIIDLRKPVNLSPEVTFIEGDYGDRALLKRLSEFDEVILLAYSSVPKTSFEDPLSDVADNLPSVLKFLESASKSRLKKIIIVSSGGTIYGKVKNLPINEEHPTNPLSPYGITKLAIEKYVGMFQELKGLPAIIVRPGNAYGPGQKPFMGQGLIATAIACVLEGKEITLFGNRTIRDYIYISDLAEGIFSVLDKGEVGECYNIGTGVGTSNKDIINVITKLAKNKILMPIVKINPPRNFDVPTNVLDSSKLTKKTDWKPAISFEEGIEKTWKWFYEKS